MTWRLIVAQLNAKMVDMKAAVVEALDLR